MRPFQFSLEAVLRLRAEQLEKTRQAFAEAMQWRARAANALAEAQAEIDSCHAALTARRECRTTRADQVLFLNALQYQQSLLQRLTVELSRVEREVGVRRHTMLTAQRKLDALERLRERKQRTHQAHAQREEERMIDDLIGSRYVLQMTEVAT
jgi:flagellar export protein FliJ